MAQLSRDERARGVIAASAGNHAQGVALAAQLLGIQATIFMPANASLAKVSATRGYGATVRLEGESFDASFDACLREQRRVGAVLIHPFDDPAVIAGQGTVACEILDDLPGVDAIVAPIGGGGLISGIAIAAKAMSPTVKVYGVEADQADAVWLRLHDLPLSQKPSLSTIADGIAVKEPGRMTLGIIQRLVDDVVTVTDDEIARTIVMLLERSKLVVEGAGAASLAAVLSGRLPVAGRKVAVLLSGGNIDINLMARLIEHGLATAGRYLIFETFVTDKPGELAKVLELLAGEGVNVLGVEHLRPGSFLQVGVMLTVETQDAAHGQRLLKLLRRRGYQVNQVKLGSR